MDRAKIKSAAASYGRAFIAGMLALLLAGETDPVMLLHAGVAAIAPLILRWVNPKDKSFGVIGE